MVIITNVRCLIHPIDTITIDTSLDDIKTYTKTFIDSCNFVCVHNKESIRVLRNIATGQIGHSLIIHGKIFDHTVVKVFGVRYRWIFDSLDSVMAYVSFISHEKINIS